MMTGIIEQMQGTFLPTVYPEPQGGWGWYLILNLCSDPCGVLEQLDRDNLEPLTARIDRCITRALLCQVIQRANGVKYGLAASLWTQDVTRSHRVSQKLQVRPAVCTDQMAVRCLVRVTLAQMS